MFDPDYDPNDPDSDPNLDSDPVPENVTLPRSINIPKQHASAFVWGNQIFTFDGKALVPAYRKSSVHV